MAARARLYSIIPGSSDGALTPKFQSFTENGYHWRPSHCPASYCFHFQKRPMQLFSAVANSKDPTRQKIINFADIVGVICLSGKVSASGAVAANFARGSLIAASAVTSSCRPRPVPSDTAHGQVHDAALAVEFEVDFFALWIL